MLPRLYDQRLVRFYMDVTHVINKNAGSVVIPIPTTYTIIIILDHLFQICCD
jgi:hypothetical protein